MEYRDGKTEYIVRILEEQGYTPIKRLLVVGCGNGLEAAILAQGLKAEVIGIDMPDFEGRKNLLSEYSEVEGVGLRFGDATNMEFEDGHFDFVYSFHALEHIPEVEKALSEMNRVLAPGGAYYVGTPNRARLFAYFGAKEGKLTFSQKVRYNVRDWIQRFQGKFRNEYGAHAGFTRRELRDLSRSAFGVAEDATSAYYLTRYKKQGFIVRTLITTGLGHICFPSVYVMGRKLV